ncbi:glycosyl hydrolase family 18 protein [Alkalihalobacillus sp. 1P02AB]|uniref:glycosyl hydrolase family 18 protein n=1 Tax=Alkalihalobacillus sp. 1P02AB TaxID=3132260 RepID=UPI0039A6ADEF
MKTIAVSRNRRVVFALVFSLLLVLSSLSFLIQPTNTVHAEKGSIVLGYYTSWNPPENLDPNKVTHINYAFADVCWEGEHGNPDNEEIPDDEPKTWSCKDLQGNEAELANGTIVLYDYETDLVELPKLAQLKNQNKDLKTLISVGGWTLSNNLSLVARTDETRETFAQSAVDFVRAFDLDGLDLDWEYPVAAGMPNNHRDPSDKENHTLLLQAVRDAFNEAEKEDSKEYLVTIAGAATWTYAENNELGKIAEIVDYMAIMSYDINGTWTGLTGHNSPLYFDPLEEQVRGWSFGIASTPNVYGAVPKDKLLLGLPFYGHSWAGCNEENDGKKVMENGAYQQCAAGWEKPGLGGGTLNYDIVKPLINQDGYNYFFDNVAKVPYLYNENKGEFISYDNVESLGYKVNFIKETGLAGAMVWDLAGDDGDYNLLKTVSYGLGVSNEAPEPDPVPEVEIGLTDDFAPVSAGSLIKVLKDGEVTGVQIQLPADLPEGTKLKIEEATEGMDKLSSIKADGPVYTFTFEYPDGEAFTSEEGFGLTFPVKEDSNGPALYYFNSEDGEWKKVSDEVAQNEITVIVPHFSTFGIFVEDEEIDNGGSGDENKDDEDKGDGTGTDGDDGDDKGDGTGTDGDGDDKGDGTGTGTGGDGDDKGDGIGTGGNGDNKGNDKGTDKTDEGKKSGSSNELPNTATNLYNILVVGFIVILVGAGLFIYQRRRELTKE